MQCRDCPLCANRDHGSFSKDLGCTLIHGTHVPVEEPSTASRADMALVVPNTIGGRQLMAAKARLLNDVLLDRVKTKAPGAGPGLFA